MSEPKKHKPVAPKIGDAVKIGKASAWGVEQEYAGLTGEVVRRSRCPPGYIYVNVAGVGERYIAKARLRVVTEPT